MGRASGRLGPPRRLPTLSTFVLSHLWFGKSNQIVYDPGHDRPAEVQEHEGVKGHDHEGSREGGRGLDGDDQRHRARTSSAYGDDSRQDREGPRGRGQGPLLDHAAPFSPFSSRNSSKALPSSRTLPLPRRQRSSSSRSSWYTSSLTRWISVRSSSLRRVVGRNLTFPPTSLNETPRLLRRSIRERDVPRLPA